MAGPYTSALMPGILVDSEVFRYKLSKKWVKPDMPVLESFHYIGKTDRYTDIIRKDKKKIFLDSGAFSMFTQGIDVDLKDYADFVMENDDIILTASNLDVIGRGNEKATMKNQKILEDFGARIQPVHHARDKDKYLAQYLEAGYDYIFLGGMVPEHSKYLRKWLDRIWDTILTDSKGKPLVKVHGFGLTTPDLMLRYPWYSVDSTSWLMAASSGSVYIPVKGKLKAVAFSDLSPSAKKRGSHFNTLSSKEQKKIRKWFKKYKFKEKNLQGRQYGRSCWNMLMFRYIQDTTDWPTTFVNPHRGLFHEFHP